MCGRYQLNRRPRDLAATFQAQLDDALLDYGPNYNVAPTHDVPIVRLDGNERRMAPVRWGLIPSWAKDAAIGNKMINARADTAASKPAFRSAMKRRRCLVPADGFYEWKPGTKPKQPFMITLADGEPMALAGLWESWREPGGPPVETCTILTTDPNEMMAEIHNRMPVILPAEAWDAWLDAEHHPPEEVQALLRPYPAELMMALPVSTRVNSPRNNDAECIRPLVE